MSSVPTGVPTIVSRTAAEAAETAVSAVAEAVVTHVARSKKANAMHVAMRVPGLCHTHAPTLDGVVDECGYCRRRGNALSTTSGDDGDGDDDGDDDQVMSVHVRAVRERLISVANDILSLLNRSDV